MSSRWAVICPSLRSTQALATRIARTLGPGTVIGLVGELGAGKTSFVQGLAQGLDVDPDTPVVSPTYALVNEYPAAVMPLVHIDLFRLESASEVRALGIEEQLGRRDAVVAVEWADHLPELMPPETIWVHLDWHEGSARKITVAGVAKPKRLRLASVEPGAGPVPRR